MLKVFGLVFIHTHTHIHTQRHSPLTHPALCRSYYVTLLRAEVWYGNNQVHIICETPLLIMWHSQSKSIQSSRPMIQNHFHCCELPGVLPPGWIRRWHMMLFHCQMHLLWERPWSVSFFFYFYCCSSFLLQNLSGLKIRPAVLAPLHGKFPKGVQKFPFSFWLQRKWDKYLTKCMVTFFFQSHFNTTLLANFIPPSTHLSGF